MDRLVKGFFVAVLVVMVWLTVAASLDRGVFAALGQLWSDPWFRATLADAYFAFAAVYLWVAWRERTPLARVLWLVLFLGLGSIGIALYVLLGLFRHGGWRPWMDAATLGGRSR